LNNSIHKFRWLLLYPKLYAWLISKRRQVNYEKLLYLNSINKGDVAFDIGANIGSFTQLFSILCGNNGEVHCFEPIPETFAILVDGINNLQNVKAMNLAAGDANTNMVMNYNPNDSEKASLLEINTNSKTCNVEVIRLDDYISEINLKRLDFIKCDVEGYELQTLKGMKGTLEAFHPEISLEVTIPYKKRVEMVDLLKSLGYDYFRKIERGYPEYNPAHDTLEAGDYFYLHASSSSNS